MGIARGAVDRAVDLDVALDQLASVGGPSRQDGDVPGKLGESLASGATGGLRRPGRGERLQLGADLGDVGEIGDVDSGGERAAARVDDHETIHLELLQRLPDRVRPVPSSRASSSSLSGAPGRMSNMIRRSRMAS